MKKHLFRMSLIYVGVGFALTFFEPIKYLALFLVGLSMMIQGGLVIALAVKGKERL